MLSSISLVRGRSISAAWPTSLLLAVLLTIQPGVAQTQSPPQPQSNENPLATCGNPNGPKTPPVGQCPVDCGESQTASQPSTPQGPCPDSEDTYDISTGNEHRVIKDLSVPGALGDYGLDFSRQFRSRAHHAANGFGRFCRHIHNWEYQLYPTTAPAGYWYLDVTLPDGTNLRFWKSIASGAAGEWVNNDSWSPSVRLFGYQADPTSFSYILSHVDGSQILFEPITGQTRHHATLVTDTKGRHYTLEYTKPGHPLCLTEVTAPCGRSLQITWTDLPTIIDNTSYDIPTITKVSASNGDEVTFSYDKIVTTIYGRTTEWQTLTQVDYPDGAQADYNWQPANHPSHGCYPIQINDPRVASGPRNIEIRYVVPEAQGFVERIVDAQSQEILSIRDVATSRVLEGHGGQRTVFNSKTAYNAITRSFDSNNKLEAVWGYNGRLPSRKTDALGQRTDWVRDSRGRVTQTTHPDGTTTKTSYDSANNVASTTDRAGRTTSYTYDSNRNRLSTTHPDGRVDTWQYNSLSQVTEHTQAVGTDEEVTTRFVYNGTSHLLTDQYEADGSSVERHTSFTYDSKDRLASQTLHMGTGTDRTTGFAYDAIHRRTSVTHPDNTTETWSYDDHGNLLRHTDQAGLLTVTTYDHLDRKLLQTVGADPADPTAGLTTAWTYDYTGGGSCGCGPTGANAHPATITTPAGITTRYFYDMEWRVTQVVVGEGSSLAQTTTHTLDTHGRPSQVTYPDATTATFTYDDPTFANPQNTWNPPLTPGTGKLKTTTDQLGRVTEHHYDQATDQLIRTVLRPTNPGATTGARVLEYAFTAPAQGLEPLSTTVDPGASTQIQTLITGRDAAGRVTTSTRTEAATSETLVSETAYDALGRVIEQTSTANSDPAKVVTTHYDLLGRVTSRSVPAVVNNTPTTAATGYQYNQAGEVLVTIRPDSASEESTYDAMGRVLTQTDAANFTTAYSYDARGQVLTLTDANNQTTSYQYDDFGRQISMTWPDGSQETSSYDADSGLLVSQTSRHLSGSAPAIQTIGYDDLARPQTLDWNGTAEALGSRDITLAYDDLGRLTAQADSQTTISYAYDAAGQLLSETTSLIDPANPSTPTTNTVSYSYDSLGRRSTTTYPSSLAIQHQFNNEDQLLAVADTANPTSPIGSFNYDIEGKRTAKTLANATQTAYTFDVANQLTQISHTAGHTSGTPTPPSAPIATFAYSHDILGDITSRQEAYGVTLTDPNAKTDLYQYDLTRQLTQTRYGHRAGQANEEENLSFDGVGNRISHDLRSTSASTPTEETSYTTNQLNQYTELEATTGADQIPVYDQRGNLTQFQTPQAALVGQTSPSHQVTNTLVYDAQNRLNVIENGEWKITQIRDAKNRVLHRLIEEKDNSGGWQFQEKTVFIWDGWSLLEERTTQADGAELMRRYVHGPNLDELLRQENFAAGDPDEADPPTGDDPTIIYFHHDRLGSTVALSDTQGEAIEFVRYTSFGWPTLHEATATGQLGPELQTSAFSNRHLYTGREWLREVSLADHRNRYYSPYLGRWTSTDPIQFEAGDVNLYRYVGGGVVRRFDNFGLHSVPSNAPDRPLGPCPEGEEMDDAGACCCDDELVQIRMNSMHGDPYFGNVGGLHTQLQVQNPDNHEEVATFGFFPRKEFSENSPLLDMLAPSPGRTKYENPMQNPSAQTIYRACPDSVDALMEYAGEHHGDPWSLASAPGAPNCTGWACQVLEGAGFTPPVDPLGAYPNAHNSGSNSK